MKSMCTWMYLWSDRPGGTLVRALLSRCSSRRWGTLPSVPFSTELISLQLKPSLWGKKIRKQMRSGNVQEQETHKLHQQSNQLSDINVYLLLLILLPNETEIVEEIRIWKRLYASVSEVITFPVYYLIMRKWKINPILGLCSLLKTHSTCLASKPSLFQFGMPSLARSRQ